MNVSTSAPQADLAPDREIIAAFLTSTIARDIHLVAIDPTKKQVDPIGRWFGDDVAKAVAFAVQYNSYGWGIYWTVNVCKAGLHKKPGGGKDDPANMGDMVAHRFLHVDIDPPKDGRAWSIASAAADLAALRYPPSLTIASGGGLGAFWRLDEAECDKPTVTAGNRGLAERLGGDHCHNHDRIMRLPGTVNYPDARKIARGRVPAPSFIFEPDDGVVYPLHVLAAEFPSTGKDSTAHDASAVPDDFDLITANDLDLGPLDPLRSLIDYPRGDDRSVDAFACAGHMHRKGYSDAQILGVIVNPANAVSAHILGQRDPRYQALRTLNNSRPSDPPNRASNPEQNDRPSGVNLDDFRAYMLGRTYIFMPTGEQWPGASVNARVPAVALFKDDGSPVLSDKKGKENEQVFIPAAAWLDQHRPVEQMTWAPGEPQIVPDRLISDGGWIRRDCCNVFNLYRPPLSMPGDPRLAAPWIDHVRKVYPEEAPHIVRWLAHRVQRPGDKINHAIVLGGSQGVGKDTILEPVKAAIGPWNFAEVSPQNMLGRFNGFVKSVILRVSEARDLGDMTRFEFYDHMKTYTAAPPDVLRVDEKNIREYSVFNCCGVIITTNHKTDGIYLPEDDRRHFVAWSNCCRDDFEPDYWRELYRWYANSGAGHVAAYLRELPLDDFDPKAPPPKTAAFWDIVASNQAPEEAELETALEDLDWPHVVTIDQIAEKAPYEFRLWLRDRKNSRSIPHKLDKAGYAMVRSEAKDGYWRVDGRRCAIYAKRELGRRDALIAAQRLAAGDR